MKNLYSILFVCILTTISCTKKSDITQTFIENLPIVSTSTPTTAIAGQNITSNVRCELSSISGSLVFQGFNIKEVSSRQFNINAKALYKDWNTQIGMPVMWTLDTIASINTITTGKYILNFYNSNILVKSDTVQVN